MWASRRARPRPSPEIRCTKSASRTEMEVEETPTSSFSSGSAEDFTNDDVAFAFMFFLYEHRQDKYLERYRGELGRQVQS